MQLVKNQSYLSVFLVGLFLLTGCRTYGGGGDPEITASLIKAADQVEVEGSILETEAMLLAQAAERHPELIPYSERMQQIVASYAETVTKQGKLVNHVVAIKDNPVTNWIGQDRYRALHRAYGAIISERRLGQSKRHILLADLEEQLGMTLKRRESAEVGRLQIRPHFYNRSWMVTDLRDLLAGIESEPTE